MKFEQFSTNKEPKNLEKKNQLFKYLKILITAIASFIVLQISAEKTDGNNLTKEEKNLILKEAKSLGIENFTNMSSETYQISGSDKDKKIEPWDNTDFEFEKEKFKKEAEKYREYGRYMSYNIVSENPNEYQKKQIKEMQERIFSEVSKQKFDSLSSLIGYINNAIDNDFENQHPTINLKDAFPESSGEKAKGTFDCDSRSIMCLSILEKMGISGEDVSLHLLEGHTLLYISSQNAFFEMTTNSIRELSEAEIVGLSKVDSFDKYFAFLLAKEGTDLAYRSDVSLNEDMNEEGMSLALEKLATSIKLNPNDLTANLNFLYVLKKSENVKGKDQKAIEAVNNLIETMLNNYYGINNIELNKTPKISFKEIKNTKKVKKLSDLGDLKTLTIKALQENEYISGKFGKLANDLYFDFNNLEKALDLFEMLAESKKDGAIKGSKNFEAYSIYKKMMANCYFESGQYEKYLNLACNELYQLRAENFDNKEIGDYLKKDFYEENYKITVAEIISGKIKIDKTNIDDFCKKYKEDNLLGPIISGKEMWNFSFFDAVETLKKWEGYPSLLRLINDWRKENIKK